MFVLRSAVRNVYSAVGNVHSALRNIKQKPFSDTITNSFRYTITIAFVIIYR